MGAKRKYNRGRAHPGLDCWVFGGIDTTSKRAFLRLVDDRKRETLLPIILNTITQGSHIWSDTWAPYFTLNQHGYQHSMVNHSQEFVTANGVHTQEIESFWGQIKAELKIRRGYNKVQLQGYLDEFMFRRAFPVGDFFEHFLGQVANQYHVNDY